ncbi:MAG: DUF3352 domain-containing protein [Pirellulales bacterium]|nr:DUF3352 domain-containing protein [Pirellulales bacterium]
MLRFAAACLATIALICGSAAACRADEPAGKSLVELVPDDVGVCIELRNMQEHGTRIFSNPLFDRLTKFPPLAEWVEDNGLQLTEIADRMAAALGVPTDEFSSKLFGQHVVMAAWPADAPGLQATDEQEQQWGDGVGLVLLEASDRALLERFLNALSPMGPPANPAGVKPLAEARQHAGLTYRARPLQHGDETLQVFLTSLGNTAVLTNSEALMRRTLELQAGESTNDLSRQTAYREAITKIDPQAAIRVFMNPRVWDGAVLATVEDNVDNLLTARDTINQVWKAASYSVAAIDLDHGLRVDAHVQFDPVKLGERLTKAISGLQGGADGLDHIPQDAIFAAALQVDLGELVNAAIESQGDDRVEQLDEFRDIAQSMFMGMDVLEEVLPQLGPEINISLRDLRGPDARRAEPGWVVNVKTKPRPANSDQPEVAEVLQSGLVSAMNVAVNFLNNRLPKGQKGAAVLEEEINGVRVTSLTGMRFLPAGLVPAFAVHQGYFTLGTSRQAVLEATAVDPAKSLGAQEHLRKLLGPRFSEASQVVYIDCARMRQLLDERPEVIRFVLGVARGMTTRQVNSSLQRLDDVLALAETIVLATKFQGDALSGSLVLSMDPPNPAGVVRATAAPTVVPSAGPASR